jgi:S-adenosyl methyltransferase
LDIGTGIPTAGNVRDVAQEFAPESRVLYLNTTRSCWPMLGR